MASRLTPSTLVIVCIILIFVFNPGSVPHSELEDQYLEALTDVRKAKLDIARNFTSETANGLAELSYSGNLTGFRPDDGFYWNKLSTAKSLAQAQFDYITRNDDIKEDSDLATLWQNCSGWLNGQWRRFDGSLDLSSLDDMVNRTLFDARVEESTLTHNVTGQTGKVQIALKDYARLLLDSQAVVSIGDVSAKVRLQEDSFSADRWEFLLHGLHDRSSGSIVLATNSEFFDGTFALPLFFLSDSIRERITPHFVASLNETILNRASRIEDYVWNRWGLSSQESDEDFSAPQCELIVYLQQIPFPLRADEDGVTDTDTNRPAFEAVDHSVQTLDSIEAELRNPTGLYLPAIPSMRFTATMFSPDCGYLLESEGPTGLGTAEGAHLSGIKTDVRYNRARQVLMLMSLAMAGQLLLLMSQIATCGTPSKKSRVSFGTMSMLSLGSGFISFAALLMSTVVSRLAVLSLIIAFLAFMDGLFLSMRFLLDIWLVQEPEREQRSTTVRQQVPVEEETHQVGLDDQVTIEAATPIPTPIPAPVTQPPAGNNGTQGATGPSNTTFGVIYLRYCLILLFIAFMSIWAASSWPRYLRVLFSNMLTFAYISFWVPQIWRNVYRNCRKGLSRRFVLGQSFLRLLPIAYLWGIKDNVLFTETEPTTLVVFCAWLVAQVIILFSQEVFGPRFFVAERWSWVLPVAYKYHPILREDEEGALLPVGFTPSSPVEERAPDAKSRSSRDGVRTFDCAICVGNIDVAVIPGDGPASTESKTADVLSGGFLARRLYSVTPCRHIFHTACLETWMGFRLICPICRESLPPL